MDRHHLLDLFEKLHETYTLKEQDYKTFVEALGGKKEPLDVTGAKIVLVNFDRIDDVFDEDFDEPSLHCIQNCKKILKVIPSEDTLPAGFGATSHGNVYNPDRNKPMQCLSCANKCEILEPVLQKFAEWIASGDLYRYQDLQTMYRFNSIEVLQRE